jgi:hypothetical protein
MSCNDCNIERFRGGGGGRGGGGRGGGGRGGDGRGGDGRGGWYGGGYNWHGGRGWGGGGRWYGGYSYPYVYSYPVYDYPITTYPVYDYPQIDSNYVITTPTNPVNTSKTLMDVLQYAMQNYPDNPSQDDKNRMILFINNLPLLVCTNQTQECKVFVTNYLANVRVENVVANKQALNQFFITMYNNLKTRYANI